MILISDRSGQTCNQLILFIHCIATGIESNQNVCHLYLKGLEKSFVFERKIGGINIMVNHGILSSKIIYRVKCKIERFLKRDQLMYYKKYIKNRDIHLAYIKNHTFNIISNWYFRNYEAVYKYREYICTAIKPQQQFIKYAESRIKEYHEKFDIVIAVHIRRGDYVTWEDGRYYYNDLDYTKWISQANVEFAKSNKTVTFVIFTNETINKDIYYSMKLPIFFANGSAIEDFALMTYCDYIFGPPSTFSWCAHYFGGNGYCVLYDKDASIYTSNFKYIFESEYTGLTN